MTQRDKQIVEWIARLGAASAQHVAQRFGLSPSRAYRRLHALVADRLLLHAALLHGEPGLYVATRYGLRWCGLGRMGVQRLGVASYEHAVQTASAHVGLEKLLPRWRVFSDREIRVAELDHRQLVGSIKTGELPGGRPALHRPDLLLVSPDARRLAVEVELSIKARRRLQTICRGYARARHLDAVYYLAAPAAGRAVARAASAVRADDRVRVLALENLDALVAALDLDHA
jgi:hypothetical protein